MQIPRTRPPSPSCPYASSWMSLLCIRSFDCLLSLGFPFLDLHVVIPGGSSPKFLSNLLMVESSRLPVLHQGQRLSCTFSSCTWNRSTIDFPLINLSSRSCHLDHLKKIQTQSDRNPQQELSLLKHMYTKALSGQVQRESGKEGKEDKSEVKRVRFLMPVEVQKLLSNCTDHSGYRNRGSPYRMRKGELFGLKWAQVNSEQG